MRSFKNVGPLVLQRLVASWRLLSVLAFGILVAATLLAVSPVYTRVMNDIGLQTTLAAQVGSATRNALVDFKQPLGSAAAAQRAQRQAELESEYVGWFVGSEERFARLNPLTLSVPGQPVPTGQFRTLIAVKTISNLDDHARVVEGRMPVSSTNPGAMEIALPVEAARFLNVNPGDRLAAAFSFDDCNRLPPSDDPVENAARAAFRCVPGTFVTLSAPFTVVGTIEREVPDEAYWSAGTISFARPNGTETEGPTIDVLLPEQSFFHALPAYFPGIDSEYRLTSFADLSRLDSSNLQRARESLAALRAAGEDEGFIPDLALQGPLTDYNRRASFNQVTLLVLLLQVVGIAVYYVVLVATLLAERRAEETAMLRSRGATVMQIVALSAAETACLAVASAVAAPFLASAIVSVLGKTGTFNDISGDSFLPFTVVPASFVYALGGAAIGVLAVVVPSFFAARTGMVVFLRGAARPGTPFLQRYYIDVALAGLAGIALWELNQRGSVFDASSVGGWSADPLLLLSPLLLILAVGALLFRFLPLTLRLLARIVSATAGPGMALGLWQLTRRPSRYVQLALLVVMAASVGTFAATYSATTDRSQEERARFAAGVDLRTTTLGDLDRRSPAAVASALTEVAGVEAAGSAYRGSINLGPLPNTDRGIQLLAVDPEATAQMLWYRDDFAPKPLEALMLDITGSSAGGAGISLKGEPVGFSLWASPTAAQVNTTMWLRTVDAAGVYHLHEMGKLDFTGYRRVEARINPNDGVTYPLSIVSVLLTQAPSNIEATRANLYIDDVAQIEPDGTETVIEDFEGAFRWDAIRTATRNRDTVSRVAQGQRRGEGALQFGFRIGASSAVRGAFVTDPNIPLPAIASSSFLRATGVQSGGEVEVVFGTIAVPLIVSDVIDYFPTLTGQEPGFLIVNQRNLYSYLGVVLQQSPQWPNEAWMTLTTDPAERAATLSKLRETFGWSEAGMIDQEKILESVRSDPVVRAGGSGVLLIALVAAFSILALGFVLTLYLGGQQRTVELSVMRAVGLSSRQIFAMIALEYLLIAAIGLVVGTIAGLRISDTMLSFLNVTEDGGRVLPPFALNTRWDTVAIAFGATGVAFVGGIVALALYFLRLPVSRILRLTR